MYTCLFTGESLGPETKEEHTIPAALGGRVKSKRVSSSCFNNKMSPRDDELVGAYKPLIYALNPLLPTQFRRGLLQASATDDTRLHLDTRSGAVSLRSRFHVIARDEAGGPTELLVPVDVDLDEVAMQLGLQPSRLRVTDLESLPCDGWVHMTTMTLCHGMEVAALKAALLTFDELLADGCDSARFTRHPVLGEVRDFVSGVANTGEFDHSVYDKCVMGLQYDKLANIEAVRRKKHPHHISEFEHILVASAEASTGCLDLVWSVFGLDPFGFRLTRKWRDSSFTWVIASGVLRETKCSSPHYLPESTSICAPTERRSASVVGCDDRLTDKARFTLNWKHERRSRAFGRAIELAEMQCDKHVRCEILRSYKTEFAPRGLHPTPSELFSHRLKSIFRTRETDEANLAAALPELQAPSWPNGRPFDPGDQSFDWCTWIAAYREAFAAAKSCLGLPQLLTSEECTPVFLGP